MVLIKRVNALEAALIPEAKRRRKRPTAAARLHCEGQTNQNGDGFRHGRGALRSRRDPPGATTLIPPLDTVGVQRISGPCLGG
jgi:hypothetical protein